VPAHQRRDKQDYPRRLRRGRFISFRRINSAYSAKVDIAFAKETRELLIKHSYG